MINLKKTAELRKMAEDKEIEGWEDMGREELLKALNPKEKPEEEEEEKEEVDLSELSMTELKEIAKEKGADIKGLRKKTDLIKAIKKAEKKEETSPKEKVEEKAEKKKDWGDGITEGHVPKGTKAQIMREHLLKQPRVKILIPFDSGEKPGVTVPFTLNGYRMNVAKGVYVDVPEQIADMVMKSQKQTVAALNHPLNITNPDHPKKKSGESMSGINA